MNSTAADHRAQLSSIFFFLFGTARVIELSKSSFHCCVARHKVKSRRCQTAGKKKRKQVNRLGLNHREKFLQLVASLYRHGSKRLRLNRGVALRVLGVTRADAEASAAVRLVRALVVLHIPSISGVHMYIRERTHLDVAGTAERSSEVQEVVAVLYDEATASDVNGRRSNAADWWNKTSGHRRVD